MALEGSQSWRCKRLKYSPHRDRKRLKREGWLEEALDSQEGWLEEVLKSLEEALGWESEVELTE
jgi:hypothetical protein